MSKRQYEPVIMSSFQNFKCAFSSMRTARGDNGKIGNKVKNKNGTPWDNKTSLLLDLSLFRASCCTDGIEISEVDSLSVSYLILNHTVTKAIKTVRDWKPSKACE